MTYTCTKRFSDYPAAHRQWRSQSHCAYVHGHSWAVEFKIGAKKLDLAGFVYDFGKFKEIKDWLDEFLDHSLLLCEDDPLKVRFEELGFMNAIRVKLVPSTSCEGLAHFFFGQADRIVKEQSKNRAFVVSVTVFEDGKNSATYGT